MQALEKFEYFLIIFRLETYSVVGYCKPVIFFFNRHFTIGYTIAANDFGCYNNPDTGFRICELKRIADEVSEQLLNLERDNIYLRKVCDLKGSRGLGYFFFKVGLYMSQQRV